MASGRHAGYVSEFQGKKTTSKADLIIPFAVGLPLAVIDGDTKTVTFENTSLPTGTPALDHFVRICEVGGPVGGGVLLGPLGSVSFGGGGGSWNKAGYTATNVSAAGAVSVAMIEERVGI